MVYLGHIVGFVLAALDGGVVVLKADFRPRPPEMRYGATSHSFTEPLVVILERACERAGCKIDWQDKPFPRSMRDLSLGRIHIVPRLIFISSVTRLRSISARLRLRLTR